MVPLLFVVSNVLGIWKRVVEPVELTEKRVEVAVPAEEEPIAKRVEAACEAKVPPVKRWKRDVGVEVPTPMSPVEVTKMDEVACATPASLPTKKLPLVRLEVCLELNVVQSVLVRRPVLTAEALR